MFNLKTIFLGYGVLRVILMESNVDHLKIWHEWISGYDLKLDGEPPPYTDEYVSLRISMQSMQKDAHVTVGTTKNNKYVWSHKNNLILINLDESKLIN